MEQKSNGKIIAYVIGSDTTIMLPLVTGLLRAIIAGKIRSEKIAGIDLVVIPVLRSNAQEPKATSSRVNELLFEWSRKIDPQVFGLASCDALHAETTRFLGEGGLFLSQVQDTAPDVAVVTDVEDGSNPWEYPLFSDPVTVHQVMHSGSSQHCAQLTAHIAQDLVDKVWQDFDELLTIAVDRVEAESNVVKFPGGGVRIENMLPILQALDLNYTPDLAVIGEVTDDAAMQLFKDLPPTEYNVWLLSCLVTGIQARLPEVSTMWAMRQEELKTDKD